MRRPLYELRKVEGTSKSMMASAAYRFEVPTRSRSKYRRDLKSAALTLLQEVADLGQQLFLLGQLWRRGRRRLVPALQLVHETDHDEQDEGDDEEIQRQREKIAPRQHRALLLGVRKVVGSDRLRQRSKIIGEIEAAGDRADDRHDDIADQRGHDAAEGRADNNADRQVDDIALHRKFAEFLQHAQTLRLGFTNRKARHIGRLS